MASSTFLKRFNFFSLIINFDHMVALLDVGLYFSCKINFYQGILRFYQCFLIFLKMFSEFRSKSADSIIVFLYSFKFFEDYIRSIMLGSGWTGIQKCIDITVPSGLRLGLGWVNLETISWDSIGNLT